MITLKNELTVPSPISLMLFLTQDCQLRCTYCFEEHRHDEKMSLEVAIKAADYVAANAKADGRVPSITLFGGEPLLMWGEVIVPLVNYIRTTYQRFNINMTTNGLLLTQEKLLFLKANKVSFMLSIDGAENGNNATRKYADGRGAFDGMEEIIDLILELAPSTQFRMTVTPSNVQYLYESVQWFHDKSVKRLRAFPNIYGEWPESALQTLDEQLQLYNEYLYSCFNNAKPVLVFDIYDFFFKKIMVKQYELETDQYRSSYFCQTCNRCGIGLLGNFMCNYKGDLFTCDRYVVPDASNPCYVGTLDDGVSAEKIGVLFDLCDETKLHSTAVDCSTCPLDHICSGGCIPVNYQITGSFTEVPESYCKYNQIVYKNVVALLEKFEADQTCDGFKTYFQEVVQRGLRYVG